MILDELAKDWTSCDSIPYKIFEDQSLYEEEIKRIFKGPVWNYLCHEVEIPNNGDILTTHIADTPIIVTRDLDGNINAMVNRCAHKGALVCIKEKENRKSITCLYHAWNYDLKGQLKSVAFQKGCNGAGGMPADFNVSDHKLQPLRVTVFCGVVFGTFSEDTPSIEEYMGENSVKFFARALGRKVKILGRHSQMLHNNWKLYAENVRDAYHGSLLHTFYNVLKLNRLDMDGGVLLSDKKYNHVSYTKRGTLKPSDEYNSVHAAQFKEADIEGKALIETVNDYDDGITHNIQTIFPTLVVHYTLNSLAIRYFIPRGVDKTELCWLYLGLEDDTPEKEQMRVMQGNLTGAAGLVSLEDGCINNFVHRGVQTNLDKKSFLQMGGTTAETNSVSRASEAAVRGFWYGYRDIMGINNG